MLAISAPAAACLPAALGQAADNDADAAAKAAGATSGGAPVAPRAKKIPPAPQYIEPPAGFGVAPGPYKPSWESISNGYQVPEWYRDAKFGIWAHWGPQCQPEMGDWYAQRMYQPKNAAYKFHVEKYGHPSKFGFKDVINEWKADKWNPEELVGMYKKAGAKFFAAMANHHDNLDLWDSKYQPWNSVAVGPKKNIVAGWEKATRAAGLRFAISCHGDRAWDWLQVSQDSDPDGPLAGVPYDGLLTKEDGKGKWWDGLDPQDLYAQYHERGRYRWTLEGNPPVDPKFCEKFFNRTIDLIDKYNPDLLYFDDTILPLYPTSDVGLRIAAYLYNKSVAKNGKMDAVLTGKGLKAEHRRAMVYDVERGVTQGGEELPWQTDTCIGSWHYERRVYEQKRYKTSKQVVQMLVDIVSKNGNLMLSVPVRGDGTIDELEVAVVQGIGGWMAASGDGIYGTRPWKVYGEGPSVTDKGPAGQFGGARDVRSYTAADLRFTTKGDAVYAFSMVEPENGRITIKSLAEGSQHYPKAVGRVELLGADAPLSFERTAEGLVVSLPGKRPTEFVTGLKILPKA